MDERTLCRIWRAQRFGRQLLGTRGEGIAVVYRGRCQAGPGPDFQEAMLEVDGELRVGDVEIHVRASDWWLHGHHRDPRYARVILHAVLDNDRREPAAKTGGADAVTLDLSTHLDDPRLLEEATVPPEPDCQAAAFGPEELGQMLDHLGDERLAQKAARYESELAVAAPEEVLYRGILDALGYSRNRRGFAELARRLPAANVFSISHRRPLAERLCLHQALLFGVAGLLPSQRAAVAELDWPSVDYADEMESIWRASGYAGALEMMAAGDWTFGGVRPLNYPTRRLGAAGHLLARHLEGGLIEAVLGALTDPENGAFERLAELFRVAEPESYWAGYFDFGRPLGQRTARLVGDDRARDIALNAALPFALAYSTLDGGERAAQAVWSAYREAPGLAENEVTRQMRREVLAPEGALLARHARRQQALIHVFNQWCDRRLCLECPLGRAA